MKFLIFSLLLPLALQATELAPWYGRSLEIELRGSALLQYFRSIATPVKPARYHSFGQFYTLSSATSFDRIGAELELILAKTPARSFGFDNFRFTGRYIALDDVIGDPVSLTIGATLTGAGKRAVYDISSFHHGIFEIEAHAALGREVPCERFWVSRWWGLFGCGTAIDGRPWLRGNLTLERNFWDIHALQAFVHTLWGLGKYNINLKKPFPGYGLINHRSVDLGLRYSAGVFSVEGVRRVYAWNFPKNATLLMLRITYPIGL